MDRHHIRRVFTAKPLWALALSVCAVAMSTRAHSATVTWISHVDGAWNNPANWSTGTVPGRNDDVVIDVPELVTVTYSLIDSAIASLDLRETLRLTGNRLTVNGNLVSTGTVALAGGVLRRAVVSGGSIVYASGTLDSVTVALGTVVKPSGGSASLTILNGLALNGTLRIGVPPSNPTSVLFSAGSQVLSGSGEVKFVSSNGNSALAPSNGGSLTIGPGIAVHGWSGTVGSSLLGLTNQGTISADSSGSVITVTGTNWCNTGVLQATAVGSILSLAGTMTTPCLGTWHGVVGRVQLTGTLDNSSSTLVLDASTGPLTLQSPGRINGGTIAGAGIGQLVHINGTLDGATIAPGTVVKASVGGSTLTILNGLTLNGTLRIGFPPSSATSVLFSGGSQVLSGSGEVKFVSSNWNSALAPSNGGSLTIGPGIAVHGWSGTVGSSLLGLTNQGTISADSSVSVVTVTGTNWCNTGVLQATVAGSTLSLAGTLTTPCLGTWHGVVGKVQLTGTLDNSSSTLVLDASTGPLTLQGRINGGTIAGAGIGQLVHINGTLDGATIAPGTVVKASVGGSTLTILNGLTLNGTLRIGFPPSSATSVLFSGGSQVLSGSGVVRFVSSNGNSGLGPSSGGSLTIGPGIAVHGWSGTVGSSLLGLTNQGTISADSSVSVVTVTGTNWCNTGVLQATVAGSTLSLAGTLTTPCLGTWHGVVGKVQLTGTLDNSPSTLVLDASTGPLTLQGRINGGTIAGAGIGQLVHINGTLDGATIAPGTVVKASVGGSTLTILNGLTLNGTLRIGFPPSNVSSVLFSGGSQVLSGSGVVRFVSSNGNSGLGPSSGGSLTIGPGIAVHGWSGTVGSSLLGLTNQGTISADSSVSVITVTGTNWQNATSGVIRAAAAGSRVGLAGTSWCNAGTIEAVPSGAILDIKGSTTTACLGDFRGVPGRVLLSTSGLIDNTSDSLAVYPTIGTIEISGGTIRGGLIAGAGPAQYCYASGTLDNVQVAPGAVVKPCLTSGGSLTVVNHMQLDGALWLGLPAGGSGSVTFSGNQTLDGQGEAKFVTNSSTNALAPVAGSTLTLGGSVLVHGRAGRIGLSGSTLVNQTTVVADTAGNGFTFAASPWRNEGTVRADRGAGNLTCSTPFVNAGTVTVDSARTFSLLTPAGTYTQTAGVTTLRKGAITISAPAGLDVQGGTVQGIGTVSGGLNNGGQVLPGLSPGTLSITGKYTQADSAALRVEIAGPSVSQYDRLVVTDRALLRGTLQVSLTNSFTPSLGDSFVIMQYASGQGLFPQLDLPSLGSGLGWRVRYRPTLLSLTVSNTTDLGENEPPGAGLTVPIAFWAYPAKPNPFNPTTRIGFDMPRPAGVSVLIYDTAGRVVRRLLHGAPYEAGRHAVTWDGRDDAGRGVASGVYAYRFQAGDYAATRRMVLVK